MSYLSDGHFNFSNQLCSTKGKIVPALFLPHEAQYIAYYLNALGHFGACRAYEQQA